ncbi:efflux RND transporter periplasmic adaptor subunit [Marinobacterium stanieri]|uniref:RND family efflux transporter, MFP subunit n=1 Tax=Marinobacterium stanieri TaxID=49186 RepID=A0A1N6TBG3_9GAMM|nr:efflux RND transporter periplasmic adaptor subunit [Marinobacterium stanieri]SIQ50587.1 RND family efflux transporter, MFP subunit [Marinobacterium stanieri]
MKMPASINLFVLLSSLLLLSGCQEAEETAATARPLAVSTQALEPSPGFELIHTYAGRVEAAQNSALGFETRGKLKTIAVDSGDYVKAGQQLAWLDTQLLDTEVQRLKAQQQETQARLRLARTSLERLGALEQRGYASTQNRDELEAEVDALKAAMAVISSNLARNRLQQEKAVLIAPFDARVGQRLADEGMVLSAGQPVLQLLSESGTEFTIGLPPEQATRLQTGQTYTLEAGKRTLSVDLIQVGAELAPMSRTLQARFRPTEPLNLPQGTLVRLQLPEYRPESGYWVPISALTDSVRGLWQVYVVSDSNQVEARDVRILHSTEESAYISGALGQGEQLLNRGLHRVVPGQAVEALQEVAAGGAQQ